MISAIPTISHHSFNHPAMWHHIIGLSVININHCKITLMFLTVLQYLLVSRVDPSFLESFSCISCADPVANSSQIDVHILFFAKTLVSSFHISGRHAKMWYLLAAFPFSGSFCINVVFLCHPGWYITHYNTGLKVFS